MNSYILFWQICSTGALYCHLSVNQGTIDIFNVVIQACIKHIEFKMYHCYVLWMENRKISASRKLRPVPLLYCKHHHYQCVCLFTDFFFSTAWTGYYWSWGLARGLQIQCAQHSILSQNINTTCIVLVPCFMSLNLSSHNNKKCI